MTPKVATSDHRLVYLDVAALGTGRRGPHNARTLDRGE